MKTEDSDWLAKGMLDWAINTLKDKNKREKREYSRYVFKKFKQRPKKVRSW